MQCPEFVSAHLLIKKQQSNSKLTNFFLYSSLIHKTENIIFLSFTLITVMAHSFLGDNSHLGSGNGARLESGLSYSARKDQLELVWREENVPSLPWGRRVFQKDLFLIITCLQSVQRVLGSLLDGPFLYRGLRRIYEEVRAPAFPPQLLEVQCTIEMMPQNLCCG